MSPSSLLSPDPVTVFSDEDKLACVVRELRQRQRVYPRLLERHLMSRTTAQREINLMQAIVNDFTAKVNGAR